MMTALVLVTTVTALVSSLGAPLVPAIAESQHVSLSTAQWSLTITLLVGGMSTPVVGRLGDGRLRRPVMLGGLALVCLGTLLAALPLGFGSLLAGRALQGAGMSLAPLAMAVARDSLPRVRVRPAIALLSVSTVAGAGLGYPVTAVVANRFGISGAFWFGLAMSLWTMVLAAVFVPDGAGSRAPVDWVGACLLALGTGQLLLALSIGARWGWLSAPELAMAAGAVVLLGAWVLRSLRHPFPVLDLRLATLRGVLGANLTAMLVGVSMYIQLTLVMLVVQAPADQGGLGRSVVVAGLMFVPYSLTSVLGNRAAGVLARRLGPDVVLPLGCLLYCCSTLLLALAHDDVWQVAGIMLLGGLGSGCTFAAMPALIIRFTPQTRTGSAMGANQVLRYVGFAIGSAVTVVILELWSGPAGPVSGPGFRIAAVVAASVAGAAALAAFRSVPPSSAQEARER